MDSFWEPFCVNFQCFFRPKNASMFASISGGLLEGFWEARPSKMELSCTRNVHFNKVTFFVPEVVFDAKWSSKGLQNGAKKPLKINQKSDASFH